MRKLVLTNYPIKTETIDQNGNPGVIELPYKMRDSVIALMFVPDLKLSGVELLKQNALALKIEACKEDTILLEESEWERLVNAVNAFKGFTRKDVELVERITNAESVDINKMR
jgi:hypothetical protein